MVTLGHPCFRIPIGHVDFMLFVSCFILWVAQSLLHYAFVGLCLGQKTKNSALGTLRDWSLITGRGGLQNGRGGHVKFYPYEKGGRKKF